MHCLQYAGEDPCLVAHHLVLQLQLCTLAEHVQVSVCQCVEAADCCTRHGCRLLHTSLDMILTLLLATAMLKALHHRCSSNYHA